MAAWWAPYIRQRARQLGLDPRAVLAVASAEGLSGGVGDGGHAFGPFQLNDSGGVLTGRPGNHRAFAESRQGIDYALSQIAGVARGQSGQQAIASIVRRFERPANPSGEIQRALGSYGGLSTQTSSPLASALAPAAAPAPNPAPQRAQLAQDLIAANQQSSRGQMPDYSSLFRTVAALKSPSGAQVPFQIQSGVPSGTARNAVRLAKSLEGTPYVWGGSKPGGFDCSGLLQYVERQSGVSIPRTTYDQWKVGQRVAPSQLRSGDAVFFGSASGPHHVGLYVGNGYFIEAPHSGAVVRVSKLAGRSDFVGGRRYH